MLTLHPWSVLVPEGYVRTVWVSTCPADTARGYSQAVAWTRRFGCPIALKVGEQRAFGAQALRTLNGGYCPACQRPHSATG